MLFKYSELFHKFEIWQITPLIRHLSPPFNFSCYGAKIQRDMHIDRYHGVHVWVHNDIARVSSTWDIWFSRHFCCNHYSQQGAALDTVKVLSK